MAKMRLSEAILAGSTLMHPKRGALVFPIPDGSGDGSGVYSGCALGMAAVAIGVVGLSNSYESLEALNSEFPVLWEVVNPTCSCWPKSFPWSLHSAIIHLFDKHVMSNTWTLEQLVDWVREIEDATEEKAVKVAAGKKEEFAEILEVMST